MTCSRRELGEREEAERRQVGNRLVHEPGERCEVDGVVDEGQLELVMLGAEQLRDVARVGELVALAGFAEADRERLAPARSCGAP